MEACNRAAIAGPQKRRFRIVHAVLAAVSGIEWEDMDKSGKSSSKILIDEFLSGKLPDDIQFRVGDWISRLKDDHEGTELLQELFDSYCRKYRGHDYRTLRIWTQHCKRLGFVDRKGRRLWIHKKMMRVAAAVAPLLIIACSGFLLYDRYTGVDTESESIRKAYVSVTAPALRAVWSICPAGPR